MNEVNETLRILTKQITEYQIKKSEATTAYDEFSLKCQSKLRKEEFDYISDLLYKLEKYYESKINESIAAKEEIMKKYNIPGADPEW